MHYLNYTTKDELGKIIARPLYPSEEEMERIREVMLDPHRPAELSFRGQILKTRNIEVLDENNERRGVEKFRYDLNDPQKRAEVRMFEDNILRWFQEGEGRTFQQYLAERKVIEFRNKTLFVTKPMEYGDLSAKWHALQELRFRRKKAEESEQKAMLAGIKDEYPIKSAEEIDVAGMF